jgi:serine/threonine protein kinase
MLDGYNVLKDFLQKSGDTYEYIRHLGGGEFSNVYLIRHKTSGKEHALKILDYHYLLQRLKKEDLPDIKGEFDIIKRRFISEAKLYKKIDHPNIVKIHETGVLVEPKEGIEIPYFIMDYVKGATLSNVLKKEAPLKLNKAKRISRNVLTALEMIHRKNIIHRDLKPANIIIEEETGEAIIIDFGIAKDIVSGTRLTTTGALLGSPMYMAPEQFSDSSSVGPGMDIYAFGAVLFEMLTGEPPFKGNNFIELMNAHRNKNIPAASEKNPALSSSVDHILFKAMAKDPNERYKSAAEFLDTLAVGKVEEKPPKRSFKYLIFLSAIVILAAALLVILNPFNTGKNGTGEPPTPLVVTPKPQEPGKTGKPGETRVDQQKTDEDLQRDRMKTDVDDLNAFLGGEASPKEKLEKGRDFLQKYQDVPENSETKKIITDIRDRMKQLEKDYQFRLYIDTAKKYAENHQFKEADEALDKAKKLKEDAGEIVEIKEASQFIDGKKAEYERINGETDYNGIKETIDLAQYLSFEEKYPGSTYLGDLQKRLKEADKRLPPTKYWSKSIRKNQKGYYELEFGPDHNGHIMIYIPEREIWIDKYEVSWQQFRNFLTAAKMNLPSRGTSKYICNNDDCPAVVLYESVEKYCRQYGFRLPNLDEWEYVAGKRTYKYPWGNELPGEKETWQANFDSLGDKGSEEKDGYSGTAPVKSFETFSSPFGVVNMAGNVWEWVQGRILKGGCFLSTREELAIKYSIPGSDTDPQGFRCVKDEKEKEI